MSFSDLTLTLTWDKYETISLVSTFVWSLGVHMESFGRKMLRLRSLRSSTWKHPILTFDLTLTWHVTWILNFRKWFGSVSSRSFECRLVRLSTSIRFRDSTGGSDPTPPGCGGYRNSPGGGGLSDRVCTNRQYHAETGVDCHVQLSKRCAAFLTPIPTRWCMLLLWHEQGRKFL